VLCAHSVDAPSQSFQTVCDDADGLVKEVPPALTTSGWDPGSSTASAVELLVGKQSSEPVSPDAAMTVCPCTAIRWKIPFSVWRSAAGIAASQTPQLVETTWELSSLAIRLKRSKAWASSLLGAS
jgi:hypothetical protein